MTTATPLSNQDISLDDYCVLGLATCFVRDEGEIKEVQVIEPIPSAALEALIKGIPTSYQLACAKSVGEIFKDDTPQIPAEFPPGSQFCDDFNERTFAAVRTYQNRPQAKNYIPLGTIKDDFNYSLERKRILNQTNVVTTEDNVKQHSHTHKRL